MTLQHPDTIWGLHSHETPAKALPMKPTVSVLVPAHNEARYVSNCIASVLNTGWPREKLEILVIDHGSTDSTAKLARAAGADILHVSTGRIGAIRNVGLAAAKSEIVAYVDADCTVPPTWLETAVTLLEADTRIGAVGGPCLSPAKGTWVERSLAPSEVDPGLVRLVKTLATSSFITRPSLLRAAGGFDETLNSGEDDDMSNRILSMGFGLVLASDCHIVHHGYPQTWWSVLKKEVWHGSHHVEVRTRFDITLFLTFMFLATTMTLPALLAAALLTPEPTFLYALAADLFLQCIPPSLLALKRIRQSPRDWRMILPFLAVGYAYFAGHAIGVLPNLWRWMTARSKKTRAGADH